MLPEIAKHVQNVKEGQMKLNEKLRLKKVEYMKALEEKY
jgi:hypothetical protein